MNELPVIRQELVPARVSTFTTLALNRPSSAAYGLGTTSTDSTASEGSSTPKFPVDGSTPLPAPMLRAPCVGLAPLTLMRPSGWRTTPGSTGRSER